MRGTDGNRMELAAVGAWEADRLGRPCEMASSASTPCPLLCISAHLSLLELHTPVCVGRGGQPCKIVGVTSVNCRTEHGNQSACCCSVNHKVRQAHCWREVLALSFSGKSILKVLKLSIL